MKKLLIISLLFIGCNSSPSGTGDKMPNFKIVTDDKGCEYYEEWVGNTNYVYIHLGRCSNPIHYFKDNNTYKYVINLPDNYSLLSTNIQHPDTLTGYISRDTLYIGMIKYQ